MKTREIGCLEVSVVGLGTNNFGTNFFGKSCGLDEATEIISAALDSGCNLIDTAEEYSVPSRNGDGESEQIIGEVLRKLRPRRSDFVISSKFLPEDVERPGEYGEKRVVRAFEGSLRRLGVDYIDLYQQHRPDPHVPVDEILSALDRLIQDGKIREIACSNFNGAQIDSARAASAERGLPAYVASESRYNLLVGPMQEGVLEACHRNDMMLLAYYPLASGLLTGKYSGGGLAPEGSRLAGKTAIVDRIMGEMGTPAHLAQVRRLDTFAKERGHTLLELAISWLASQSFVGSVITGATSADQIMSNVASSGWDLSEEDFEALKGITVA